MQSFVEAKAAEEGHGDVSTYVRNLIAAAQKASLREQMDAKLEAGVDALDNGQGRELAAADWEALRQKYR
jgi:hypothetical protein